MLALLSKLFSKTEKDLKLKSLRKSLDSVYNKAKEYMEKDNAKQIMALKDYQLILGVTQVMWEEQVMADISAQMAHVELHKGHKPQVVMVQPSMQKNDLTPDQEFDLPEFMTEKKKTVH